MNKYVKSYLQRGLAFAGFGPITLGIVYMALELTIPTFTLSGIEVLVAIISTYGIAFVHAGSSVFNQIEEWPLAKSLAFHFGSLYLVYLIAYLVNTWIPFDFIVVLIFTLIFVLVYFLVWIIVYLSIRSVVRKLNERVSESAADN